MIIIQLAGFDSKGSCVLEYNFADASKAIAFMKARQADRPDIDWVAGLVNTEIQNMSGVCMYTEVGNDPEKIKKFF